jgi:hypothetical protein
MITVVTWLWNQKGRQIVYRPAHVNIWARMVSRNLTIPHRLLCITDNPQGIDIETYPLWKPPEVINPSWGITRPQCYVRLKAFSSEMRDILGDRFVSMDLDCVVTGNLDKLLTRSEDFIINRGETKRNTYNGSMWMMNTGAREKVWTEFSQAGIQRALQNGYMGSDQAWIRECLGPNEATFSEGVKSFVRIRPIPNWQPTDTSVVFFQGNIKPWEHTAMKYSWVRENYR